MSLIVCSYGEIHLKGANRGYFLRTLLQNMRQALGTNAKVELVDTRILVTNFTDARPVVATLKKVFGFIKLNLRNPTNYVLV